MKNFRPIFLKQLDVTLPGLRVRRLRLNRHLPETASVRPHAHRFSQILLYLGGRGVQHLGESSHLIRTGTAVFLPPRQIHAFSETQSRRPLCLVIDLDWRGAGIQRGRVTQLNQIDLSEIRQHLSQLGRFQRPGIGPDQLRVAGIVLQLLDTLWRSLNLAPKNRRLGAAPALPIVTTVRRVLLKETEDRSLSELAREIGYQQDYLNRLLKTATGLTLGQMRSQMRVTQAQRLLRESRRVADVAAKLGFDDANYFARWFRLQTGLTPRQYQRDAEPVN